MTDSLQTTGWTTHVFGGTLAPGLVMPWLYGPRASRLSEGGEIRYHAMPRGGLGRTDQIVEWYLPLFDEARANGEKVRLMGHSLGGVVAWSLAHECRDVVDTVEVWGAPLRGTGVATFFRHFAAEARFLAPMSRWLERYNRPLDGPRVRSMYTALDLLVLPPRESCYVEGARAENHYVTPLGLRRRDRRPGEKVHVGLVDHVLLPRHGRLVAAAA